MWPCGKLPPGLTGCNNGDWLPVQDKYWWKTDALQWNAHSLDIYYHRQSTKICTLVVGGCVWVSPQWRSHRDFSTRKVVKDTRDPAGLPRQRQMRQNRTPQLSSRCCFYWAALHTMCKCACYLVVYCCVLCASRAAWILGRCCLPCWDVASWSRTIWHLRKVCLVSS